MENQNRRIFFFFFFSIRDFSCCGKLELENFFFFSYPRILVLWKTGIGGIFFFFFFYPRILVLWKTRIGEFFFFFLAENSPIVENQNPKFFFFVFLREFSFCEKPELENFFFFIREFSYWGKPESENFFFFFF